MLRRSTDILLCVSNGINTATEIAAYYRYSISTVHRLLQNLKELRWVIQDSDTHKYYLGPLLTQLNANRVGSHRYLIVHALREMGSLSYLTEETINLGILDQLHYVHLHDIPSFHNLRIIEESNKMMGNYIGATAKVLLSQLPDAELKAALKHISPARLSRNGKVDKKALLKQLLDIRKTGYCVTENERIDGAMCISARVSDYICPAMIAVVGPSDRLKPRANDIIEATIASASRISEDVRGAFGGTGGES